MHFKNPTFVSLKKKLNKTQEAWGMNKNIDIYDGP